MSDRDPEIRRDWAGVRAVAARDILRKLVAHVAAQSTDMADEPLPLDKGVYIDPVRFEAERHALFLGQPIVAGLSNDVPNPGDFLVFDAAGPSIIVARGKDRQLRAFLNMCTHRGAALIEEHEPFTGHQSRLTCPFHAWTFDLHGRLVGQPGKAGFSGCDIGGRPLIEVPAAESRGLIFVRPGGGAAIDADAHLGTLGPVLDSLELDRAVAVKKGILHADSNWKFALDTYGEGYHFGRLHASTIGKTHHNDIGVVEPFGRHHRVSFPDHRIDVCVGAGEDDWLRTEYGGVHYLFPNTVIFFGSLEPGKYFTQVFRLFPDGVGKTRCQFAVYSPFGVPDDVQRGQIEYAYDATAEVVQTEDYRVAAAGYANLLTAPDGFKVVLGRNELAPQLVHRHIAEAIAMPLN